MKINTPKDLADCLEKAISYIELRTMTGEASSNDDTKLKKEIIEIFIGITEYYESLNNNKNKAVFKCLRNGLRDLIKPR